MIITLLLLSIMLIFFCFGRNTVVGGRACFFVWWWWCFFVVIISVCTRVDYSELLRPHFQPTSRRGLATSTQAPTFSQSTLPLPLPLPLPSLLPLLSRFSASTVLNLRSLACAFGSGFCRPHFPFPPSLLLLLASTHTRSPVFTLLALVCPTLPAVAYLHSISASPLSAANC